jgi:exodeoxyribonuclease V alpha subunit
MNTGQQNLEKLSGIVERITYHNEQNGWSVLKVSPFKDPSRLATVLIHQAKVYAGATMEFWGSWSHHSKHGEQFKAIRSIEKKPASAAALEKYLGSGLIAGVGPATAKKIVRHFKDRTLEIFEDSIEELTDVPGIADKKLEKIKFSWDEHRSIRDVMIFLQGHGISTLFATKIYKTYGDQAISIVSGNPYRLAHDIYGIGFFSADKIALSMGFSRVGRPRIEAGIKHVLSASRDEGHCFLTQTQIIGKTLELLNEKMESDVLVEVLENLLSTNQVRVRKLEMQDSEIEDCFYSKSLYSDEKTVAELVATCLKKQISIDQDRVRSWVSRYCEAKEIQLSDEQHSAVCDIPSKSFSILTGGPGCGKTTCTEVLVKLLRAMGLKVTLAAPTGRAAQRMSEVIGLESKTIHRLLEWAPDTGGFKFNEENPVETDFLILDEVSMLDISLAASLLKAIPAHAQILLIGDPDQLPAVGAGNVLSDLLETEKVPRFRLTKVFRQAQASSIIRFAHEINSGMLPKIISPIQQPEAFSKGVDCLFVDADEATV